MSSTAIINRRQLLRFAGTSIAIGALGVGTASGAEGHYIVGTASGAATREARRQASSVKRVLDFGPIGTAVAGTYTEKALRGLNNRPDVRYIEPDGFMYAIGGTGDIDSSDSEVPWGVDRVDAEKVHTNETGSGADLAIIDTGIDNDHPDLIDNLGTGISYTVGPPWSSETSTDPADWDDGNGHGTHCAGIAGAVDNGAGVVGVSTQPTLHAVKVLDNSGRGSWSDVAAGIKYVADQSWDVGSMSLGGGLSDTVKDACSYAYSNGVLLVAAAGNDGDDVAKSAPAAYSTVMAISATRSDDTIPSWSNYGDEIELAAPGVSIYSTYKGGTYDTLSGTSMACPHVSGAGAILMAGGSSNSNTRKQLNDTAEDLGTSGFDIHYGNGLLDVEAAVGGSSGGSSDTTAPSAPSNLTSTGQTDTTVDLSWDASSDDVGVDHYNIYVNSSKWGEVSGTTATVDGLSADTTHDFYVTAEDAAGNESGPSNTITVTTDASSSSSIAIDSFDAASVSPNNPHAEVEMSWSVSGSPDTVTLNLYEGTDTSGTEVGNWSVGASGTQTYTEKFASPKWFTAELTATKGVEKVTDTDSVEA